MAAPISSASSVPPPTTRPLGPAGRTRPSAETTSPGSRAAMPVDLASAPVNQRELAQVQARDARVQDQARILERVDSLVQGMESLARRMSSDELSPSQRSVLRSRFNELEQQVNRVDGIVGGEGREAQGERVLTRLAPPGAERVAGGDAPDQRARTVRAHVEAGQRRVASRRAQALQAVARQLGDAPPMETGEAATLARAAAAAIQARGTDAISLAAAGNLVDMNA